MKISAPNNIIEAILDAIETNINSRGIALQCDVTHELGENNGYIEFIPKEGVTILPRDWFWFGYYVREYVD